MFRCDHVDPSPNVHNMISCGLLRHFLLCTYACNATVEDGQPRATAQPHTCTQVEPWWVIHLYATRS